jgi:glutamate/tyrosine decarboxylase-like PLP-dependent enzyme
MLKHLGREGIAAMVERHCRLAKALAGRLGAEPRVLPLRTRLFSTKPSCGSA